VVEDVFTFHVLFVLVSNVPPELTAAQLIEAIIAQETRNAPHSSTRRRAGSRSSNCSDHTSDTLSADESQYEDDRDNSRPSRRSRQTESTTLRNVVPACSGAPSIEYRNDDQLAAALRAAAANATSQANVLAYQTLFPSSLLAGKLSVQPKDISPIAGMDMKNIPTDMTDQRLLLNSNALLLSGVDRKTPGLKVGGGGGLRVRDVIHTAIEENLLTRPAGDPSLLHSSDEVWKIYAQQSQSGIESPMSRLVDQMGTDSSQVQDLSCRRSDGGQSTRDGFAATSRGWSSDGPPGRKLPSPPPAHSNYGRQQPMQPVQIDPRSQDPLYHLAEVAVQRELAEVGDRSHPRGVSPHAVPGVQHMRELDQVVPPQLVGGSISRGTPLHSASQETPGRLSGLARHEPGGYMRRLDNSEIPKSSRDVVGLQVNGPQVVAMAETVLQYLNPAPSLRAVMENTVAAIQPQAPPGSASRSVLTSDFVTAQMMSNAAAGPRHRLPLQPDQPVSYPGVQQSLSRNISDMDAIAVHLSRESQNGGGQRAMNFVSRSDAEHAADRGLSVIPPASAQGGRQLTAATVIEAIITQQINKDNQGLPNAGSVGSAELVNRILDPMPSAVSTQPRRVTVNGTQSLANGISAATSAAGLLPRVNVNERIEMERSTIAASRLRNQERIPGSSASQGAERAVTLGEHIDAMIQKDFSAGRFGDETVLQAETIRFSGRFAVSC
jgi:hypothetical protein